ncbi:MAG: MotA/TolQ/ExbB proton channel family protein [Chitinispirillaceae bacterium]|nr:MotA/TolQ/ExbB proton channel family protein [Chitinispirillaceae bacterium]
MQALLAYLKQGGIFMYPIVIGCLWALTLLVERAIFYFQTGANLSRQLRVFFSTLEHEGNDAAVAYLSGQRGILKNVLVTALEHRDRSPELVQDKMEVVLVEQLPAYSRYLNLLASLAGLMPIFGLLGTVSGMIMTFRVISLHGTGDAQAMASGIAEALITTQAGLVAAAPIMLGHVLLTSRVRKISDKTREACVRYITCLKEQNVR